MTPHRRVLVLGLDGVPPDLLFDRFRPQMPSLHGRLKDAAHGTLKSCDPPITVPAWAVMFTGMDAGSLGLYGFRNRAPGTYFGTVPPSPGSLPYPLIWTTLSRSGRRTCVVGMPPGYPPIPVNGITVSDLLTPDGATDFAYPPPVTKEIDEVAEGYVFDVPFRSDERERVGEELIEMTRKRWKVARHLWAKEAWDLFVVHEIGTDRIHHAFWKYFDPRHPRHVKDPVLGPMAERYYRALDEEIGRFLESVGEDVTIFVVSDHGGQPMSGAFCINDWLASHGYLTFRARPAPGTPLDRAEIDWSQTRAWGAGGYYARIHVNRLGREPEGIVPEESVEALLDEISDRLRNLVAPNGTPVGVEIARPADVYEEVRGLPPDLLVYFGDLRWRSAGTVGHPSLFLDENDTGPDDAVHSWNGVVAATGPGILSRGQISPAHLQGIAPTILALLGVPRPATMRAVPISGLVGRHLHAEVEGAGGPGSAEGSVSRAV